MTAVFPDDSRAFVLDEDREATSLGSERDVGLAAILDRIVHQIGNRPPHGVIIDNLSTHKPKRELWLARHPRVHFHYTPTHTSWLNQIEIWFSILAAQSLSGASFQSVDQLKAHIDAFIAKLQRECR